MPTIFLTFILLNLFSSSLIILVKVIIREFPSISNSLFKSKVSEKINSSRTLLKSVHLIMAYEFPYCVFFSWIFNKVAAIFEPLTSLYKLKSLKFIILYSSKISLN